MLVACWYHSVHVEVPKNGGTPKSSITIGIFHEINPAIGVPPCPGPRQRTSSKVGDLASRTVV